MYEHLHPNKNTTSLIELAIIEYGKENFSFQILEKTEDYDKKEQEYALLYNSYTPNGYNVALCGGFLPNVKGENHPNASITWQTVNNIIEDLKDWSLRQTEIARRNNTTVKVVENINWGRRWVQENISYPVRPNEKVINDWRAEKAKELLISTSLTQQQIAKIVGWKNGSAVANINNGRTHKDESLHYPLRH